MIEKSIFKELLEQYILRSKERHQVIKDSSDILRYSKQAIFDLHRDDLNDAAEKLKKADELIQKISEDKKEQIREGAFRAALEEYLEAMFFYEYLNKKNINFVEFVPNSYYEEYLGGLCDLTGELVRRSTLLAIKKEYDEIKDIHVLIEDIIGELIKFNLVGKLRSKYDDVRRNRKKIEEIIYDINIRVK